MKVYLVHTGDYEDVHVCAVFSTREKAEDYIGVSEDYWIKEMGVDAEPKRVYSDVWECHLRLDGSEYMEIWHSKNKDMTGKEIVSRSERSDYWAGACHRINWDDWKGRSFAWMFKGVSYTSADEARRLAIAEREKALRENPEYFVEPKEPATA